MWLIGGFCGSEREGETMVLVDDWDGESDGVGDGDRDGVFTLDGSFVFRFGYLVGSLLDRPCKG